MAAGHPLRGQTGTYLLPGLREGRFGFGGGRRIVLDLAVGISTRHRQSGFG